MSDECIAAEPVAQLESDIPGAAFLRKRNNESRRTDNANDIRVIMCCLAAVTAMMLSCGRSDKGTAASLAVSSKTKTTKIFSPKKEEKAAFGKPGEKVLTKGQIVEFQTLLRDGRRKVQAKEYDGGIALYQKGLAIKPGDSTMLIELGYAAFLKGDLKRAKQATTQGVAGMANVKMKGAALYNLGRIAEQEGDTDAAVTRYRESLSMRPNKAVKKRLASLGSDTESEEAAVDLPELRPFRGPLSSLKAVCHTLIREHMDDFDSELKGCALDDADSVDILQGPLKRVILLPVWGSFFENQTNLGDMQQVLRFMVMQTDRGYFWTSEAVSAVWNPGVCGIAETIETTLAVENVIAGEPPEVVMRAAHSRRDIDLGMLEEEYVDNEWVLVCGMKGGTPRCFAKILSAFEYERVAMPEELTDSVNPIDDRTPNLPIHSSYAFDVSFDGKGHYTLTERKPPVGNAAQEANIHAGTFSFPEAAD